MKPRLIIGNWKMHGTVPDALKIITGLEHQLKTAPEVEVAIAPPATALYTVGVSIQESFLLLAGQHCHWEDKGAFTGEISPAFLADVGCLYVLVGHSERRQHFGLTDEGTNKIVQASLRNELIPVLCVGESEAERKNGKTWEVLDRQLKVGLAGLHTKELEHIVIAYEPVWAIGTGNTATPGQACEAHHFIRNQLGKRFDAPSANAVRILYGGSVKPDNVEAFAREPAVNGCLVGGASLEAADFAAIVRIMERVPSSATTEGKK